MRKENKAQWILLTAVFIIATCGLIYELVAGTLASYLLGDSITQFSIIIGVYLFSMGVGSYLSRFFNKNLLEWFVRIELLVGLVGGFSAAALFLVFPLAVSFQPVLYAFVFITGMLVGIEIPLLLRILKDRVEFKELVSRVFTFDYIGALLASLIFPLLFVPYLGLIRTSLFFGIMNIGVGLYLCYYFAKDIERVKRITAGAIVLLVLELAAFIVSEKITSFSETLAYNDKVVYSTSTPYQRIVITKSKRDLRLYLNNNLQFSSADEYRYHEALVHPAMTAAEQPQQVLVLGGGDGLAVREILKYPSVRHVQLVDLDPAMTKLFSSQEILMKINHHSFSDPKVTITNADAFTWLRSNKKKFDCVIIDFPDPSGFAVGKLYTTTFYRLLQQALTPKAVVVVQSTSPYVAPKSFWCVNETLKSVGFNAVAYHNYVPSFGEWGYIMAMNKDYHVPDTFAVPKRYISKQVMEQMLNFPEDMKTKASLAVNKLNNQALVNYFEEEWGKYMEQ
jgi:spermidine synthase